jgi:SNF2 family DNA or RNA helicase
MRVIHSEYGEGVIVAELSGGYCRVFFAGGEQTVHSSTLQRFTDRNETVLENVSGDVDRLTDVKLSYLAYRLTTKQATPLTGARIDLLPHQIVLTHRISNNFPRRYLVADEVGLGKTIETALILRELASRGELQRAMLIVPAGLVNNWHQELNETFHLNFEVFGSEGDVFDRRSNAFAKHDRLIASIDTLKRFSRIKKLKEAPPWDLVVFDEAHHLTACRNGQKVVKTENYKLAEMLTQHCRDMLLLSATPHQGDHFRFWMLIQLLEPALFNSEADMVENRHRLNQIIFRRTKADACRADGSTLFARRWVHTESFLMSQTECDFYNELQLYLMDGFELSKRKGNKGRALGFVMTIFQKIAASSFAAVHRTLRRRLLALTIQEGLMHDNDLNLDKRDAAFNEAKILIAEDEHLGDSQTDRNTVDSILSELKRKILSKQADEELESSASEYTSESVSSDADAAAFGSIQLALPEERLRIRNLLEQYPAATETKVLKLLDALERIWKQNPDERIVVFATYLGSVEMLGDAIGQRFPDKGVTVLKGGDHGSKLAAEKRFKQPNGPKLMICTAAGREGINLQHSRILFNFDLPWNPMDLEQRIGRIHRYGQQHTAQIYNLVLSDTIEGKIFIMLDEKLTDIAATLGKVDEYGNIAEDLRIQILGQLSERLQYDKLYSQALSDPKLKRTKQELDAALQNATEARTAVFDLFQDLSTFSLNDYKPFADTKAAMGSLLYFFKTALEHTGKQLIPCGEDLYCLENGQRITTDRDKALNDEKLELLGLDTPLVEQLLEQYKHLPPERLGVSVRSPDSSSGILSLWYITIRGKSNEVHFHLIPLAVDEHDNRLPSWEHSVERFFQCQPVQKHLDNSAVILRKHIEPMVQRELIHRGLLDETLGYKAVLVGWIEAESR